MKSIITTGLSIIVFYLSAYAQTSYLNAFWKPRVFVTPTSTTAASFSSGVSPTVTISVSLTDTLNKVLPTQFGTNSNFRSTSSILTRIPLYNQPTFGQFRFPAGSGSNQYFWDGIAPSDISNMESTKGSPLLGTASKYFTPTQFTQFLTQTGAQANIVVNYFYARYGKTAVNSQVGATAAQIRTARVKQAADYAAGFVRKMNIDLKAKVLNWEIGNECYGNWEQGYNVTGLGIVTGTEYGEDFKVFAAAMKAVDPTIKVGAVMDVGDVTWSSQVLTQVKDVADFLIIHEYFTGQNNITPTMVLAGIPKIKADKDTINKWVVKYAGKVKDHYPIALTEFNSRGYSTTNMTNGLFISSILGEIAKNGYGFSNSWVNEWSIGTDNSTHGLISQSDDINQPAYTPRTAYIPYYFYGKYFGDHVVNSTLTGRGVRVYSSVFAGGEAGLVLVNTNSTDQYVQLNLNTIKYDNKKAYWHEFYATDIADGNTKFHINGQTGTTVGGGPTNYTTIPPYQATFINNSIIKIKKYSVIYINLTFNQATDVTSIAENRNSGFTISPNPASEFIHIKRNNDAFAKLEITNLMGKKVFVDECSASTISIPTNTIGNKGIYFVSFNSMVKKLILK